MIVPMSCVGGWMNVFRKQKSYNKHNRCSNCKYCVQDEYEDYCNLKKEYCKYVTYCSEEI